MSQHKKMNVQCKKCGKWGWIKLYNKVGIEYECKNCDEMWEGEK